MSRKLLVSLTIFTVLILILVASVSCVSDESKAVSASDYEALQTRVSTLESRLAVSIEAIADLESAIARLESE